MKLQADLFPYPVLSKELDDYVDSAFKVGIEKKILSPTQVEVRFEFNVTNKVIQNLLYEGKAVFAVHLEGIGSSYRELITAPIRENTITVILSADEVNSKIEMNKMIIANEVIENYSNPKFNSLYYGEDFTVPKMDKGEIIAFDNMSIMKLDFDNREGHNYQSMIRVAAKDDYFMTVDIDGEFILVNLPTKAYEIYVNLSQNRKEYEQLFLVTVIQPALVYVIEKIQSNEVEEGLKWFDSLSQLLQQIGYDEQALYNTDSLKIAQQLLDMPVEKSFVEFYEMGDSDE